MCVEIAVQTEYRRKSTLIEEKTLISSSPTPLTLSYTSSPNISTKNNSNTNSHSNSDQNILMNQPPQSLPFLPTPLPTISEKQILNLPSMFGRSRVSLRSVATAGENIMIKFIFIFVLVFITLFYTDIYNFIVLY